jgi:hypothetical protein
MRDGICVASYNSKSPCRLDERILLLAHTKGRDRIWQEKRFRSGEVRALLVSAIDV